MRANTKKRAKLNRAAAKVREQIVDEVGQCEWCGTFYSLAVHEIARGCDRWKAQDMRSCVLVLCNAPHGIRQSCHGEVGAWDRAKQLALLLLRRGGDYDLAAYHRVIDRNKPDQADVDGWVEVLLKHGK